MKNLRSKSETRIKKLEKIGFNAEVEKLRKDYTNTKRYNQIKHLEKNKTLRSRSVKTEKNESLEVIKTGKFLEPTRIISVTASKWAIFDYFSGKYIRGYRAHDPHELSIFSKLLVFCTINALVTKHKIDMSRFQTIVTKSVVNIYRGSKLKEDDIITLDHLLKMMIMDEGEEYELVAAVNIGAYLEKKRKREYYSVYDADDKLFKTHLHQFYEFVNTYCKHLKLESVKYIEHDPSLRKEKNQCNASDCLKIPLFDEIMKMKQTEVQIKYINEEGVLSSKTWTLKNRTIENPFISYFNVGRNWEQNQFISSHCSVFYENEEIRPIVVIIMASYNTKQRQKDIQQIIQWYLKNEENKRKKKEEEISQKDPKSERRIKTELPELVEQKLKTKPSNKYDFKIRGVKEKDKGTKYSRRTITEVNEEDN